MQVPHSHKVWPCRIFLSDDSYYIIKRKCSAYIIEKFPRERRETIQLYGNARRAGFSRADFARKFRKAPSASFICRYNDVERAVDPCTMYSVNENIVLPTAHTVTRAHAVSLSHTISTASRCSDAAVPALCGDHVSYIFRVGWYIRVAR